MVHCYGSLMIYARKIPAYMVVLLLRDFKAVTVKMGSQEVFVSCLPVDEFGCRTNQRQPI